MKKRIIVGISGASGAQLGYHVLSALREQPETEVHLILSEGAKRTIAAETGLREAGFYALADRYYSEFDLDACISSGSYRTEGMIIVPCSMKTLSGLANGYDENLLIRAADVCLKEGRKVVVVPREMPMGRAHLKNLLTVSEYGCAVIPPMLTFYAGAQTLEAQMDQVTGKILMQFGWDYSRFRVWEGAQSHDGTVL